MFENPYFVAETRLDPSRFANDPDAHAVALAVAAETGEKLNELEAAQPAPSDVVSEGLLNGLLNGPFVAPIPPWFEVVEMDLQMVGRVAHRLGRSWAATAEAIAALNPPNWSSFFWMAKALKVMDSAIEKDRLHAEMLATKERVARSALARNMNDKKHARHRAAEARVVERWAELKVQGVGKNEAARTIAKEVNLAPTTVREKLKGL